MSSVTRAVVICIFTTLPLLLLAGCAGAIPSEQWSKTFGGVENDVAYSVLQTPDGGYILAGHTYSDSGNSYAWLIKTDSNGNQIWNKTYSANHNYTAYSARQTSDGGYILAGGTEWYYPGSGDAWLIKTDSNGNQIWNKTYGGTNWDEAYSVQQTSDSGYIIAGWTELLSPVSYDAWLIKTEADGDLLWDCISGGTGDERAYSAQQTSDGYIFAGKTGSNSEIKAWLIKVNGYGNEQWNQTFRREGDSVAYSILQTSDAGYVLAGSTRNTATGKLDALMIKIGTSVSGTPSGGESQGGGGGGGGGGASPGEPYENIADTEVQYILTITPNKQNTAMFKKPAHHILEISFAYSQVANQVSITLEKLIKTSLLANDTPPGATYENVNIWVNVPNPNYISNATVKFCVEKSWISANKIDPNGISLYRYREGKWIRLPTSKINENETLIFYLASTPGFSPFAITGEKIETTQSPTPIPAATSTSTPVATLTPTGVPSPEKTPKSATGFGAIAVITAVIILFTVKRRRA